jgi:hypothetical protein
MPSNIKAALSAIVAIVAIGAFWLEMETDGGAPAWLILALGAFMIVAMWVFPEAGKGKSGKK